MTQHVISDHALIRYMERVQELDVDSLKDDILKRNPGLLSAINSNATAFTVDGVTFVMKNKIVTSVIEGSSQGSRNMHIQRDKNFETRSRNKMARRLQYPD